MPRNGTVLPHGTHRSQEGMHTARGDAMAPRLLVRDDEPDLLFLYRLILEPEGYDVHIAALSQLVSLMLKVTAKPTT